MSGAPKTRYCSRHGLGLLTRALVYSIAVGTASADTTPELAILLVADSLDMLRRVLRCYAAQRDDGLLEVVIARLGGEEISQVDLLRYGFERACVIDGGDGEL